MSDRPELLLEEKLEGHYFRPSPRTLVQELYSGGHPQFLDGKAPQPIPRIFHDHDGALFEVAASLGKNVEKFGG